MKIVHYSHHGSVEITRKWYDSFRDVADNYMQQPKHNSIFEECSDIVPVYKRLRKQGELNFLTAEWLLEFRSNQEIGLAFLESLNVQTSINSSSQYKKGAKCTILLVLSTRDTSSRWDRS